MSKSLVREASIEDTFDILILAKEFSKEAPKTHKWNKDKTEKFILTAIESPNATVIVFEDDGEMGEADMDDFGKCDQCYQYLF